VLFGLGWLRILVKGKARDKSKNKSVQYNQKADKAEPRKYFEVRLNKFVP